MKHYIEIEKLRIEHERYRAVYTLFSKSQKAEERAVKEGWIGCR